MQDKSHDTTPAPARPTAISRREFAVRAALASAASTLAPGALLAEPDANTLPGPQEATNAPKLSPASQAEAEARIQAVLGRYGSRLSEEQKADIRRLVLALQPSLDSLRAYPLANGDHPALYLKPMVEHEKHKTPAKPAAPAKKS